MGPDMQMLQRIKWECNYFPQLKSDRSILKKMAGDIGEG